MMYVLVGLDIPKILVDVVDLRGIKEEVHNRFRYRLYRGHWKAGTMDLGKNLLI